MRAILISADGGLRWADKAWLGDRFQVDVLVQPKAGEIFTIKDLPLGTHEFVKVQRRSYQRVGSGDNFDVYREIL